jgi:hypothetical protein
MPRYLIAIIASVILFCSCASSQEEGKRIKETYTIERVFESSDAQSLGADIRVTPIAKKHALRLRREATNGQVIYIEIQDREGKPKAKAVWNTIDFRLDFEPFEAGVYYLKLSDYQGLSQKYRVTKSAVK